MQDGKDSGVVMSSTGIKDSNTKTKSPKQNKAGKKNVRPQGYKDFEVLAKGILDASGVSYYEWLHNKHQEIILDFNVTNRKDVVSLVQKEG